MSEDYLDPIDQDDISPKMRSNSSIVSRACDAYFARKGLKRYDLKGNVIDPISKATINKAKRKKLK